MRFRLTEAILAALVMASPAPFARAAEDARSFPPYIGHGRPITKEDIDLFRESTAKLAPLQPGVPIFQADTVVNNTNPTLRNTDTLSDHENSIAVDPTNTNRIVITGFSGLRNGVSALWLSNDGGRTWTKNFTVNPPPGIANAFCGVGTCDQTIDFTHFGALAGTFLATNENIFSALSGNLTAPSFDYFRVGGVAQATNHLNGINREDQPWLLVGPRPGWSIRESVYVAYDDFNTAPDMRVAVAWGINPLRFTTDNRSGFSTGFVNPGHRLAIDPRSGAVYSLFQRRIAPGAGASQNINYMLNRSTDGGQTWRLNGLANGIVVANADSDQIIPSFCRVNQLRGGVDHAAVDPVTGDVVYVYGTRNPITGVNRLAMRRLTPNAAGGLTIGPERFVSTSLFDAAIPSVAITANRTIGVFYYQCDMPGAFFPRLSAHFAISTNGGVTFTDDLLSTFLSTERPDPNPNNRQRILGDYMQVKAVGNTFFGAYTANGAAFGRFRPVVNTDAIFYRVSVN